MTHGKFIIGTALFTLALGCDSPAEKQANERGEARNEIREAGIEAKKEIAEAKKELNEANKEYGEKVADANDDLREEVADANKDIAAADKEAAQKLAGDRYERFEIIKNESEAAFATRAEAALARVEKDLDAAKVRTKAAANEDLAKHLEVTASALAEARKDLTELRAKTGNVFDDGRLGVGTAINEAQRNLNDAYQEMAASRM